MLLDQDMLTKVNIPDVTKSVARSFSPVGALQGADQFATGTVVSGEVDK
jgi:hypothetical protein